jgi:hypothetical protein
MEGRPQNADEAEHQQNAGDPIGMERHELLAERSAICWWRMRKLHP